MNINPNINKSIVPNKYEYFFNKLFIYFPIVNPIYVKEKLQIENIVDASNRLFVIAGSPKPTEKLSKETPSENSNIPVLFKFISLDDGFIYSINIWRDIKINIIPNIKSVDIFMYFVIFCDNIVPINGIIKWKRPTVILVLLILFLGSLYIPIQVDIENASILKLIPIINKTISSFILSPY